MFAAVWARPVKNEEGKVKNRRGKVEGKKRLRLKEEALTRAHIFGGKSLSLEVA